MPVDIDDLLAERKELPVPFGPFTVTVVYNPASQTNEVEDAIEADLKEERWGASIRNYLVHIVKDWDLTKDGRKVPISDEAIKQLVPTKLQVDIMKAIKKDMDDSEGEA